MNDTIPVLFISRRTLLVWVFNVALNIILWCRSWECYGAVDCRESFLVKYALLI